MKSLIIFLILNIININNGKYIRTPKNIIQCDNDIVCRESINCQDGVELCICGKDKICLFE